MPVVLGTDRVDAGYGGQQQASAKPDCSYQDDQAEDGLAAAADRQAQAESDHGATPVIVTRLRL